MMTDSEYLPIEGNNMNSSIGWLTSHSLWKAGFETWVLRGRRTPLLSEELLILE